MSSSDPTVPQQRLMALWPGRAIDARGMLRVLNEGGAKPPLFWIFNDASEPAALARALGRDQPLVFSRSAHLIVASHDDQGRVRNILTDYLRKEISRHFRDVQFGMGTSCQGSPMLMQLGNMLTKVGIGVSHLCMINCSLPEIETRFPALLVYGDQDTLHDPFDRDFDAASKRAATGFATYRRVVLPVGHGQFYTKGIIDDIVAQFSAFRSSAQVSSKPVPLNVFR